MNVRQGVHLPTIEELMQCPTISNTRIRKKLVGADAEDTRRIWLEARRQSIGASDIPAIMGTSPYTSAFKLWCDKKGLIPIDTKELEHQTFGHLMEEPAAKAFQMRSDAGVIIDPEGIGIAHAAHPWNIVTPDRILLVQREWITLNGIRGIDNDPYWIPIEIKNVSEYKQDAWGTSFMPEDYYDQVQNQLEVLGRPCSLVLAVMGGNRMLTYTVWRDLIRGTTIIQEAEAFWNSLERDEMPPPDDSESTTDAILKLHPKTDDSEMAPSPEIVEWAKAEIEASEAIKTWEAKKVLAGNNLRLLLGDAKKVKHPLFSISYGMQSRQAVDQEAAEKDQILQEAIAMVEARKALHKVTMVRRSLKVTPSKAKA